MLTGACRTFACVGTVVKCTVSKVKFLWLECVKTELPNNIEISNTLCVVCSVFNKLFVFVLNLLRIYFFLILCNQFYGKYVLVTTEWCVVRMENQPSSYGR
jgi:hypothetical protein